MEQLEDNIDLWVENEIARQLQTVSLDDDNSDLKVEVEPAVSPEKEVWTVFQLTHTPSRDCQLASL